MTISPFGEHIEAAFSRQLERELNESKEETEDLIFDLEKSRAEVERLQSQLNRSIEIADELSSGDAWKFTAADEKLTELKKEIK
jgi:predicted RNase H-like nuclease (RuvC/YqgF family)